MIYDLDGNVVKEDDIKFLPIYTGVEGERKTGTLCWNRKLYLCKATRLMKLTRKLLKVP